MSEIKLSAWDYVYKVGKSGKTEGPEWSSIDSAPLLESAVIVVIGVWGSHVTDSYRVFWDGKGWDGWPHAASPTHWKPIPHYMEVE